MYCASCSSRGFCADNNTCTYYMRHKSAAPFPPPSPLLCATIRKTCRRVASSKALESFFALRWISCKALYGHLDEFQGWQALCCTIILYSIPASCVHVMHVLLLRGVHTKGEGIKRLWHAKLTLLLSATYKGYG